MSKPVVFRPTNTVVAHGVLLNSNALLQLLLPSAHAPIWIPIRARQAMPLAAPGANLVYNATRLPSPLATPAITSTPLLAAPTFLAAATTTRPRSALICMLVQSAPRPPRALNRLAGSALWLVEPLALF